MKRSELEKLICDDSNVAYQELEGMVSQSDTIGDVIGNAEALIDGLQFALKQLYELDTDEKLVNDTDEPVVDRNNLTETIDYESAGGTSFHGTSLSSTVKELKAVMGTADYIDSKPGTDKTNYEWVRKTINGDVFTVYDYKEYRRFTQNEVISFHIGANSQEVTVQALAELSAAIANLKS